MHLPPAFNDGSINDDANMSRIKQRHLFSMREERLYTWRWKLWYGCSETCIKKNSNVVVKAIQHQRGIAHQQKDRWTFEKEDESSL